MLERLWRSKTVTEQNTKEEANQKELKQADEEIHLPNSVGCRIIEMEMQIEDGDLSKPVLIELLQLYTTALEFYEEKADPRFRLYQKKIQNFLQKEAVDAVLRGRENVGVLIVKREKTQEEIRKATVTSKEQAKKLLENSEMDALKRKRKIEDEVKLQMQSLEKRIENKRSNSQIDKSKKLNGSISITDNAKLKALGNLSDNPLEIKQKRQAITKL